MSYNCCAGSPRGYVGSYSSYIRFYQGFKSPSVENQKEKNMESVMEAGLIQEGYKDYVP